MKGFPSWLVHWARLAGTRDLAALVRPVEKVFFLTVHYFNEYDYAPIAQQPGQAVVQGRLSRNVCLRLELSHCGCEGVYKHCLISLRYMEYFRENICRCALVEILFLSKIELHSGERTSSYELN
jgi:hypothetical protein